MTNDDLDLEVLSRTLERLGWHRSGVFRDVVEYWEASTEYEQPGVSEEVILPLDRGAADFGSLLNRAEQTLDRLYGAQVRGIGQMIRAMITLNLDEVLLRRNTPDLSGLIDWVGGNAMVESARGLLIASAKATSRPRRRFANADTTIAEEYLAACRMGQTQIGSYVVTALTPTYGSFATSRSTKTDAKKGPTFEGRQITHTLVRALEASTEAVREAHDGAEVESIESFVPQGVSLELVRALRQLVSEQVESSISVELRDEATLLNSEPTSATHEFTFDPGDAPVLDRAMRYLEESPAPRAVALSGEVVLLKNSARGAEHQIKLSTRVDGAPRTVTVTLTPDQYESALRAHSDELRLSVRGEVEVRQRSAVMEVADNVHVEATPIRPQKKAAAESPPVLFE